MDLNVLPVTTLQGEFQVPGDKSISHRAMIMGAIAQGKTVVRGFLEGKDCLATLEAMRALGVNIDYTPLGTVIIHGVGLHGLKAPTHPIDCGNSGTSMRLMAGLLSAQSFESTLIGDDSLSQRPMQRIIEPLTQMGARITARSVDNGLFPPLTIQGSALEGIGYTLPVASAQVKSCLLLAGLYAKGKTFVVENALTRDHTERMLKAFGADIELGHKSISLNPGKVLEGQEIDVPGDISSAAFFIAGASMVPGCHIIIRNVGINERRTGIIHILKSMGADITIHPRGQLGFEPIGDIEVKGARLKGIEVSPSLVASAIDEFPVIFIAAACASGETIIRGIQELRFKETDRIAVMVEGLRALGVSAIVLPDGIAIRGVPHFSGGQVDSFGDHRVAMAFAMASLYAKGPITIEDCENITTSFPSFVELANTLGLSVSDRGD